MTAPAPLTDAERRILELDAASDRRAADVARGQQDDDAADYLDDVADALTKALARLEYLEEQDAADALAERLFAGGADGYQEWLDRLRDDVIRDEFGYEEGEFTVYPAQWAGLYIEGLTPRQAWQRALDGHKERRLEEDALRIAQKERDE